MSIVTTAQAVPSRLFAIYASLFDSEHGEPRERLESWATPRSLSGRGADEDGESSTTLFSNTLQEARRLGLVEEVDDKLRLTIDARGGGKKGHGSEGYFRAYLQRTLFDPTRAVETQQDGFMLALAWFLAGNPLKPIGFSEAPQNALKREIGDHWNRTELTSLHRYQNFLYWARYLGFATIVGWRDADDSSARRAIPDPARAIETAFPAIFADDTELPIETFLSRLALIFPVFEKGSVRQEYDGMRLTPPIDAAHRLSIATSIALQRLEDRQKIVMTSVADAPTRVLDFGAREGRISHVALKDSA
jgi:hypothetical protein